MTVAKLLKLSREKHIPLIICSGEGIYEYYPLGAGMWKITAQWIYDFAGLAPKSKPPRYCDVVFTGELIKKLVGKYCKVGEKGIYITDCCCSPY